MMGELFDAALQLPLVVERKFYDRAFGENVVLVVHRAQHAQRHSMRLELRKSVAETPMFTGLRHFSFLISHDPHVKPLVFSSF